jgi:hypothetical protein
MHPSTSIRSGKRPVFRTVLDKASFLVRGHGDSVLNAVVVELPVRLADVLNFDLILGVEDDNVDSLVVQSSDASLFEGEMDVRQGVYDTRIHGHN